MTSNTPPAPFTIAHALPADATRVADLARLSGSTIDVSAELARGFAELWVACAAPANQPATANEPAAPVAAASTAREIFGVLLTWHVADELHVQHVVTEPSRRRQGIARALLTQAVRQAQQRSHARVLLEVMNTNLPALTLYTALGFRTLRVRPHYYPGGEDAHEMELVLGAVEPPASGSAL